MRVWTFLCRSKKKRKLRLRVAEHKYAIRVKNMLYPMARHINEVGHVTEFP